MDPSRRWLSDDLLLAMLRGISEPPSAGASGLILLVHQSPNSKVKRKRTKGKRRQGDRVPTLLPRGRGQEHHLGRFAKLYWGPWGASAALRCTGQRRCSLHA